MITVMIDGLSYQAEPEETVLQVTRKYGIQIPTLCYHPALRPCGSCKLCAVAVSKNSGDREIAMLSCVLKASDGLVIQTTGPIVNAARTAAFKKLLQMSPQSKHLKDLAAEYGIDVGPPPDGCIRCRLCIRVCKEIVKANALRMEKINGVDFVVYDSTQCIGCGTCANICPTHVFQVSDQDNLRTLTLREDIIGRFPLERCQRCGCGFSTAPFIHYIETRTASHPHTKDDHHYCPSCAKQFSDRTRSISRRSAKPPL